MYDHFPRVSPWFSMFSWFFHINGWVFGRVSGAFDCLSSTLSAARKVGFQLVATATIASTRALPALMGSKPAWFYAFVDSLVADRSVMAAWMLHGACVGGERRSTKPCVFSVISGCSRRWKVPRVCGGCGCGRFKVEHRFLLCVLQRVVVHVCVVLCLCVCWLPGCRWQFNGFMIVVVFCCHVRREIRVGHVMLQNAL